MEAACCTTEVCYVGMGYPIYIQNGVVNLDVVCRDVKLRVRASERTGFRLRSGDQQLMRLVVGQLGTSSMLKLDVNFGTSVAQT